MKPVALITIIFLFLVALFHLLRWIFQVPVTAGDFAIPMWMSVVAFFGTGALAILLWTEQRKSAH